MSAYFTVELDTTAPLLEIEVTKLIQHGHTIELEINSSEALAVDQNIYVVDYKHEKQTIILERISDRLLSGFVSTDSYSEGPATLHIQLWDEVGNTTTHEEAILIITDGLTYCMHDVVRYTAPAIFDATVQPTVELLYSTPQANRLNIQPVIELVGYQPTIAIKYTAPKCTVRRCHNI